MKWLLQATLKTEDEEEIEDRNVCVAAAKEISIVVVASRKFYPNQMGFLH